MSRLTFRDLISCITQIQKENNLTNLELADLPIIIGDDEELNGVHEAYFMQLVDTTKSKGYRWTDVEEKKITFEEYTQQSLETDVKEQTRINGKCILIS